jgi:hypothetical protein
MPRPLLSSRTIASLRAVLLSGLVIDGISVGGSSWVNEATSGSVTGYLYAGKPPQNGVAQPGAPVYPLEWFYSVIDGEVTNRQQLHSSADTTIRIRLVAPIPNMLYSTYKVERL